MCEFIAPEIFEVTDIARVKDQSKYEEELVQKAIQECPVSVIKKEKGDWVGIFGEFDFEPFLLYSKSRK